MAQNKQLPDLALGKRWPHNLLQMFPAGWKRRYLLRKSGGDTASPVFNLTESLNTAKRFLLIWPERAEDVLLAFPAMRVLRETTGTDSVYAHLCRADLTPLIADLFPGEQLLSWTREDLAWHEPAVQSEAESLRTFSPDISINLMRPSPTVIKALVKASGAPLRMAVDDGDAAYANLRVKAEPDSSLASLYFQFLNSWRYAGLNPQEHWPRLPFDADERQDAAEAWAASGASPERTWLYVYNPEDTAHPLDDDLYVWLWEKIQTRESSEVFMGLVVLNAPNNLVARDGKWRDVPVVKSSRLSSFSSIVDMARGVAAFQGPGLHIASLTDVRCLAFLKREESAYDVSDLNKMFTVEWI